MTSLSVDRKLKKKISKVRMLSEAAQLEYMALVQTMVRKLAPDASADELEKLSQAMTVDVFDSKTNVIQAGGGNQDLCIILKGLVRGYYLDSQGNEVTVSFETEGSFVAHFPSLLLSAPSKYSFQCLESSAIAKINFQYFIEWLHDNQPVPIKRFEVLRRIINSQQTRIESFLTMSAERRYLDFVLYSPNVFNRVSMSQLASYLGLARPYLSKIRRSLLKVKDHVLNK